MQIEGDMIFGLATLSRMTHCKMTLGMMTLNIMGFIATVKIMMLSIIGLIATLSIMPLRMTTFSIMYLMVPLSITSQNVMMPSIKCRFESVVFLF